jgi:hypothetical protein
MVPLSVELIAKLSYDDFKSRAVDMACHKLKSPFSIKMSKIKAILASIKGFLTKSSIPTIT